MDKIRAKTRSLSAITKNRAPTFDSTSVPLGTNDVGPSSKDLSFVLNNFKEIEKVRFNAALFLFLMRFDTPQFGSGLAPQKEFCIPS